MPGRGTISQALWRHWASTLEGRMAVSAGLHLLVLAALVNAWWFGAHRFRPVGSATGSQRLMVYETSAALPQQLAAKKAPVHRVRPPTRPVAAPMHMPELERPAAAGSDQALGSGEVSIMYVQAFPSENPDLAGTGSTGDIKLDLLIDETGHIARIHARTGMNESIDRMVIATVERWVFQPAMRDGHAVSSSEELHFHYDRTRNPVSCGWDCFTLEAR